MVRADPVADAAPLFGRPFQSPDFWVGRFHHDRRGRIFHGSLVVDGLLRGENGFVTRRSGNGFPIKQGMIGDETGYDLPWLIGAGERVRPGAQVWV